MSAKSKPTVLIATVRTPQAAIDLLETKCNLIHCTSYTVNEAEILEKVMGVDAILWPSQGKITQKILEKAGSNLKIISLPSIDTSNLNVEELKALNIKIGITPAIYTDAVADHAVGLMISACRRIHECKMPINKGLFKEIIGNNRFIGIDIDTLTIGFVGFGAIGQAIAKRLIGFNIAKIVYYCRSKKFIPSLQKPAIFVNFYDLLKESDVIFCCCPLNDQTKSLFNDDAFRNMKTNCVLINVARGNIIDQKVLLNALIEKKIFAAGLDVFADEPLKGNDPLLKLNNCIITPHIGTATNRTRTDIYLVAAHNILRAVFNEQLYAEA